MKHLLPHLLLALASFSTHASAQPQSATQNNAILGDCNRSPWVQERLQALGYPYTENNDGSCRVVMGLEDSRTQKVVVNAATKTYGNIETRLVWTIGHASGDGLPAETLRMLLDSNEQTAMGAWQTVHVGDGREIAIFRALVPADADDETLKSAIDLVAWWGDALECSLSAEDEN